VEKVSYEVLLKKEGCQNYYTNMLKYVHSAIREIAIAN